jgi:hypothetical protein
MKHVYAHKIVITSNNNLFPNNSYHQIDSDFLREILKKYSKLIYLRTSICSINDATTLIITI